MSNEDLLSFVCFKEIHEIALRKKKIKTRQEKVRALSNVGPVNNCISQGECLQLKDTAQGYCPWNGVDDRHKPGTADFITRYTAGEMEHRVSYVRFFRSFQTKHILSVFEIIKNKPSSYS